TLAAEQIEFPDRVEAGVVDFVRATGEPDVRIADARLGFGAAAAGGRVQRRKEVPGGNAAAGARREDVRIGLFRRFVTRERLVDELVEGRIVERPPPVRERGGVAGGRCRRSGRLCMPLVGCHGLRGPIVRTDRAPRERDEYSDGQATALHKAY